MTGRARPAMFNDFQLCEASPNDVQRRSAVSNEAKSNRRRATFSDVQLCFTHPPTSGIIWSHPRPPALTTVQRRLAWGDVWPRYVFSAATGHLYPLTPRHWPCYLHAEPDSRRQTAGRVPRRAPHPLVTDGSSPSSPIPFLVAV